MSDIFGGADNDILGGTSNDDLMKGYGGDDEFSGGGGNDELVGGGGIDLLNGEAGNDTLKGGGGNDTLNGGAGNDIDILIGGKGADTLDGGEGNDIYEVSVKDLDIPATDTYNDTGLSDGDEIDADKVLQLMLGDFDASTGIDSIRGHETNGLEIISDGHAVNWDFTGIDLEHVSQITGSGENDLITGSDGDDKIKSGGGDDAVNGGGGNDTLSAGGGNDGADGGDGDDKVKGGGGDDTLTGGDGDDTLTGGTGNDIMDGGEGSDSYVYKEGESLDDDDIEDTGTSGTDVVDLTGVAAIVLGDDVSASGAGIEAIHGAETGTVLHVGEASTGVNWDFSGATMEHITEITGSAGNDMIAGSDSDDKIKSGGGDDAVIGGEGNDNLSGGGGDDELFGDEGDDTVKGGGGDDIVIGGAGNDTLRGGAGNDILEYDAADGQVDGQDGVDELTLDGVSNATLDITESAGVTFLNIEVIDLDDDGNTVVLDKTSVKNMSTTSDTLTINGGASDTVTSTFEWTQGEDAAGYHVYTSGSVILHVQVGVNVSLLNTTAEEAPVLTVNTGGQVDEGAVLDITSAMLSATDVDNTAAELVYTITDLPDHGTIFLGAVALDQVGDFFTQADVDAGDVTYDGNTDDALADSFGFELSGGTGNEDLAGVFNIIVNADITGTPTDETLTGGAGNDILNGGAGNDTLNGNAGDDTLGGGTENDTLNGGDGEDSLIGNNGDDTLNGDDGDDTLAGNDDSDVLNGGEGNDLLLGGNDNDTLSGGLGEDTLEGGDHEDTLNGEDGDDSLLGNNGDDHLNGGDGDDTLAGGDHNDVLNGGAGDDVVHGGLDGDVLFGGFGNDALYGDGGSDFLVGDPGTDQLFGGDGDDSYSLHDLVDVVVEAADGGIDRVQIGTDTAGMAGGTYDLTANVEIAELFGGSDFNVNGNGLDNVLDADTYSTGGANTLDGAGGNDTLYGGGGNDVLVGGSGNDVLVGGSGNDTLDGDDGDDALDGGSGNDTLNGGDGDDYSLNGSDGDDVVNGGAGNDGLNGGIGADLLFGDAGEDSLLGGDDDDTLYGGDDYDVMNGGNGNDSLFGGNGNDLLVGAGGNDFLYGGDGIDEAAYNADTNGVTVNLADGTATGAGIGTDTLFDIENVTGGTGNDTLIGDTTDNELTGNSGEDMLIGGDGNDVLSGGDNNDVHKGGAGNDDMYGGNGVDTLDYSDAGQGVFIIVNSGTATGEGSDTFSNMERFIGSDFDLDRIVNNSGGDVYMDGGAGNDTLETAGGMDTMVGGAGDDNFLFRNGAQASNPDTIEDFEGAGATVGDIIQLYTLSSQFSSFSNGAIGAVLAGEFESGSGTTTASDADTRLIYDIDTGNLYYDADGNGVSFNPIHFATITGSPDGLTHEDFLLTNA